MSNDAIQWQILKALTVIAQQLNEIHSSMRVANDLRPHAPIAGLQDAASQREAMQRSLAELTTLASKIK